MQIKGLSEPAHSCYGLSLYRFLGLLNIGTAEFGLCEFSRLMDKFSLIFGQLCDKKTCAFVVMRIGKKVVSAGGRMGRGH